MVLMGCAQKKYKVQREDTCVYMIEMEQMRRQDGAQKKSTHKGTQTGTLSKKKRVVNHYTKSPTMTSSTMQI